jgi:hypothetical protein
MSRVFSLTFAIFAAVFDPGEHRVFESACHLRGKKRPCHLRLSDWQASENAFTFEDFTAG